MSDTMPTENSQIAIDLIDQISAAARAGNALVLGPQAVQNLYGLLFDLWRLDGLTIVVCGECGGRTWADTTVPFCFMCNKPLNGPLVPATTDEKESRAKAALRQTGYSG